MPVAATVGSPMGSMALLTLPHRPAQCAGATQSYAFNQSTPRCTATCGKEGNPAGAKCDRLEGGHDCEGITHQTMD